MNLDELGQFDVVLTDPPWSYHGQQDKWGAAAKFYPTMKDDELRALPVGDLLAPKSALFMWATSPRLDFAIDLLRDWGLHFRGVAWVWVKTRKDGTPVGAQGVRPSTVKPTCEYVLAASKAAKGRPLPLFDESIPNTILAPKMEHSRKPDHVHEFLERMYPDARKVEMFARRPRDGWTVWGNEV